MATFLVLALLYESCPKLKLNQKQIVERSEQFFPLSLLGLLS